MRLRLKTGAGYKVRTYKVQGSPIKALPTERVGAISYSIQRFNPLIKQWVDQGEIKGFL